MSNDQLPEFVKEALEASDELARADLWATLSGLPAALSPEALAAGSWSTLGQRIADGPLRYAPFFDELASLFGLDAAGVEAEFIRSLEGRAWSMTPFRGVKLFRVRTGAGMPEGYLVRLGATSHIPRHRHPGREITVVLEGGYRDEAGREAHAGDRLEEPGGPGHHSLQVVGGEPCVIALSLEKRFIFASPLHRALLGLFWR